MEMPPTQHTIRVTVWPHSWVGAEREEQLLTDMELFIRAAFRESTASDYQPTLTYPQSRFSFSRLGEELHERFTGIESLDFENTDIISQLTIPRLDDVQVVLGA
ncbi:hypothetical protein D9M71_749690 [compost metagenome]